MGEVPRVSAVVCAYTQDRWDDLLAAVASLRAQGRPPDEIIVVVDHEPALLARVAKVLPEVVAIPNTATRGLAGARNCGVAVARGEVVAFLDDDARARAGWLAALTAPFADPDVVAVGGTAAPAWPAGRPGWFPPEFDWVVGCTYEGLPRERTAVRNVIGCGMALRRCALEAVGGFGEGLGRVGTVPVGCEETELCIRLRQHRPDWQVLFEPAAVADHRVTAGRTSPRYFLRRCWHEGRSKAEVARRVGTEAALATERAYVTRTLARGVVCGLVSAVVDVGRANPPGSAQALGGLRGPAELCVVPDRHARRDGVARAMAIVVGLVATALGYARGRAGQAPEPFRPVRVLDVELTRALPGLPAADGYGSARLLARLEGAPLAEVTVRLAAGPQDADAVAAALWPAVGAKLNARLSGADRAPLERLPRGGLGALANAEPPAAAEPIAVVVATRDRPRELARCLDALLAGTLVPAQAVVVDSAPGSEAGADVVAGYPAVAYVREDRPGLALAHNTALRHVAAPLVAFTDDDVVVDPEWLAALAGTFTGRPDVACVTGMILPLALDTPAQLLVEDHGRFNKGFERREFRLGDPPPGDALFPYAAGAFGSGASMAFRTAALRAMGGFDNALGAGSPGRGGDDLAAFVGVLQAGHTLVYEPAATLRHQHPGDLGHLRAQAYGYGAGLSAYLTKLVVERPALVLDFARRAPQVAAHLRRGAPSGATPYPRALTVHKLRGAVSGPAAYLRGRRALAARGR